LSGIADDVRTYFARPKPLAKEGWQTTLRQNSGQATDRQNVLSYAEGFFIPSLTLEEAKIT